jgi:hypothetical protein
MNGDGFGVGVSEELSAFFDPLLTVLDRLV